MPKPRLLPCTSAPGSRSGVSAEVALGLDLQPRCWPCGVMGRTRRPRGALWQTWVEKPLRSRVSPAFFGCPLLPGLGSLIHSFARSLTPRGGGCCGKQGGLTFLLLPLAPRSCPCPSLCSPFVVRTVGASLAGRAAPVNAAEGAGAVSGPLASQSRLATVPLLQRGAGGQAVG